MSHHKALLLPILLFFSIQIQAQKWGLRISNHTMRCNSSVSIISVDNNSGQTSVSERFDFSEQDHFRGFFTDFSLIRKINKQSSLIIGYRTMNPYFQSSIKFVVDSDTNGILGLGHGVRESVRVSAVKLNYSYAFFKSSQEINPSTINVFGGLLLCFAGKDAFFDNGKSGVMSAQYYIIKERIGSWRPHYPVPYINLGLDAGFRMGKRFRLGVELDSYFGQKSLFAEKNKVITNSANLVYETKIRPYFFSGGLYLQYSFN